MVVEDLITKLNDYISTTTVSMGSETARLETYIKGLLSHSHMTFNQVDLRRSSDRSLTSDPNKIGNKILGISDDAAVCVLLCQGWKPEYDQPWESAAAFGNAVVNAVVCWFYDGKKMPL